MRPTLVPLVALLAWAAAAGPAGAQSPAPAEPDTKAIIDALTPKTRSLRNLAVRPREPEASAPAAAAPAPGASVTSPSGAAATAPTPAPAPTAAATAAPSAQAPAPPAPPPSIALQIRFDFDSARIRPDSGALLARLADALKSPQLRDGRFLVEGHTDARGAAAYNLKLSQQRADEVVRYLVERGVAADRVSAVGRGSSEPAQPQDPLAAENRRVRIVNHAP